MRYLLGLFLLLVLAADLFFPEAPLKQNIDQLLQSPSWSHPFGTDSLGRDLLLRLLAGAKISLTVALLSSFIALVIGTFYGMTSGWSGGKIDRFLMSLTEIFISVPGFIFVAVFTLALQKILPGEDGALKSILALSLGIGISHWMIIARVCRALVLRAKVLPFVDAAKALGAGDARIFYQHIWPNVRGSLWVLFGLQVPNSLLYESFMSLIGLGVQSPQISWGVLIHEGWRSLVSAPHLMLFPALVLFLINWLLQSWIDERRQNLAGS